MPTVSKTGSIFVAWLLIGGLLLAGSAAIGAGNGTILGGPGYVMGPEMTDKTPADLTIPAKVRFGPFHRAVSSGPQSFTMSWASTPGLAVVQISGCYDLATLSHNGKIIWSSAPGNGNRGDSVNTYVANYNHMTLTLNGGCIGANVYVTIQPVAQLCPECGDMAGRDITIVGGFMNQYNYYMPADHPAVGSGPIEGDVPSDHDWWDDKYFRFKNMVELPTWSTPWPPLPPIDNPHHWIECDPEDPSCFYSIRFKQTFYAPLDDTYQFEVGPFGETWIYIDDVLVYDSDWGDIYGEVTLTKGFHSIDIYHSYRGPVCDECEQQFYFSFVPNVHADADADEYFHVTLWGDDVGEEYCFLNIW